MFWVEKTTHTYILVNIFEKNVEDAPLTEFTYLVNCY